MEMSPRDLPVFGAGLILARTSRESTRPLHDAEDRHPKTYRIGMAPAAETLAQWTRTLKDHTVFVIF